MSELIYQRALRVTDLRPSYATRLVNDSYFALDAPVLLPAGLWVVWYEDPGAVLESFTDEKFNLLYVLECESPSHMKERFAFPGYDQWCALHNAGGVKQ